MKLPAQRLKTLGLPITTCIILLATPAIAEDRVSCPSAAQFSQYLQDGTVGKLPNLVLQSGIRVQLQHPDTELIAHAKFFDANERPGFTCQYYNYVGMVAIAAYIGFQKAPASDDAFWRDDFADSLDENGNAPNQDMVEVCMERIDGMVKPSVGCQFTPVDWSPR
ncbi:hypothetical protein [uncultured Algimonas sp.]|uniref:hypothetical protein n=1 Tax=uncultured Algimonas sp. TaxID=1547920 RepID=UPI0026339EA5|nr:hypothetical protein [uncultured Algimonas sp.]